MDYNNYEINQIDCCFDKFTILMSIKTCKQKRPKSRSRTPLAEEIYNNAMSN